MNRIALASLAVLLVALPSLALAEKKTHAEAKVSIDVPAGWKSEAEEHTLTMSDPNEEAVIALMVVDAKDLEKAADALDKEIGNAVSDLKWDGEPSEVKVNGMDGMAVDGKGKIEGKAVDVGVLLVVSPAGKVVLVLGAVESSKAKKHEAQLEKILKSIKPEK
jgi:predicted Zn-dependent protease